jgi:predicted HicB family RNase H-like nuclease
MGLPVPGIFLFKDQKLKKQLLVDGLQRLRTMSLFKNKQFEGKLFDLGNVAEPWTDKTWDDLSPEDRDAIDQSVIHATIFQQDYPKEKDRSIYEVFERINTGGMRLSYQEIRACVSFGAFSALLRDLNANAQWRAIFGKQSNRLKDEELILRFFALLHRGSEYKKPMREFLDNFLEDNRELVTFSDATFKSEFNNTIDLVHSALGEKAFRVGNSLNAAIFDSVMVGIAHRLSKGPVTDKTALAEAYTNLFKDKAYGAAFVRATSDDESVRNRLKIAKDAFDSVP